MPVYRIPRRLVFPDPWLAEPDGLLGVGADLSPERLLLAYNSGIFPWFTEGDPVLWWSPDPRMILAPAELRIQRSLAKRVRRGDYRVTFDTAFERVIAGCAQMSRPNQQGTWITDEMRGAYLVLHEQGHAHSAEAWKGDELVGGLYGVAVGEVFCGESMFAKAPDASKVAFVTLVRHLEAWGCPLIDCQMHTDHLAKFGAREISRDQFLVQLAQGRIRQGPSAPWRIDDSLDLELGRRPAP